MEACEGLGSLSLTLTNFHKLPLRSTSTGSKRKLSWKLAASRMLAASMDVVLTSTEASMDVVDVSGSTLDFYGSFHKSCGSFLARGSIIFLHGSSGSFHGPPREKNVWKTAWVGRMCKLSQLPRELPLLPCELPYTHGSFRYFHGSFYYFRGSFVSESFRGSLKDVHGSGGSFHGSATSCFRWILCTPACSQVQRTIVLHRLRFQYVRVPTCFFFWWLRTTAVPLDVNKVAGGLLRRAHFISAPWGWE